MFDLLIRASGILATLSARLVQWETRRIVPTPEEWRQMADLRRRLLVVDERLDSLGVQVAGADGVKIREG